MSSCGDQEAGQVWVGWVGVVIAVVFFGSNFIPVKKFDTGDGELTLLQLYQLVAVGKQ